MDASRESRVIQQHGQFVLEVCKSQIDTALDWVKHTDLSSMFGPCFDLWLTVKHNLEHFDADREFWNAALDRLIQGALKDEPSDLNLEMSDEMHNALNSMFDQAKIDLLTAAVARFTSDAYPNQRRMEKPYDG